MSTTSSTHDHEKNDEDRRSSGHGSEAQAEPLAVPDQRSEIGKSLSDRRQLLISFVLSIMCFSTTFSSSAYASSVFDIQQHFNASQDVVLLGIALFVLGFAVGPLLFGPLSFVVGKRPVYVATFLCFTAFSFGAAEAQNIETLIILRFLAGASGSSALNNVPASLTDILPLAKLNVFMMFYALGSTAGPGLAPVIMGFVNKHAGWRWNLRIQAILVACATVACILLVPETADLTTDQNDAQDAQQQGKRRSFSLFWHALRQSLARPFVWLCTEPVVTVICLHISVLYGVLYGAFEAVPFVFLGKRRWTNESTGLFFIALLIGFILGGTVIAVFQTRHYKWLEQQNKPITPETRFRQALWGAFLPPVGLFIFAWTAPYTNVHWIAPAIGMCLFSAGMMIIFTSLLPYVSLYAGKEAPMAMAATTFTRSAFGCFFPVVTTRMYTALTIQGASSLLAGVTLALAPVPIFLHFKGAALRMRGQQHKLSSR